MEKERRRRIREEKLRRQRKEERTSKIEAARIEELHDRLGKWNLANSLLEYLSAVEDAARERGIDASSDSGIDRWLDWARSYAAGLKKIAVDDPPSIMYDISSQ